MKDNSEEKYNKNLLPGYGHKCDVCVSIMTLLYVNTNLLQ